MVTTMFKTIGGALSKFWKALSHKDSKRMSDYERYLHESTDIHDLEAREREWNRRVQDHRRY